LIIWFKGLKLNVLFWNGMSKMKILTALCQKLAASFDYIITTIKFCKNLNQFDCTRIIFLGAFFWDTLHFDMFQVPPNVTNKQVAKPKLYNNNLDSCLDQCSSNCEFRDENGISKRHCWGHGTDRCQKSTF